MNVVTDDGLVRRRFVVPGDPGTYDISYPSGMDVPPATVGELVADMLPPDAREIGRTAHETAHGGPNAQ